MALPYLQQAHASDQCYRALTKLATDQERKRIEPIDSHGVKCISVGLFVDPESPTIWRGPMVMGALQQLLHDVKVGLSMTPRSKSNNRHTSVSDTDTPPSHHCHVAI
jgi:hypothetical protein